MRIVFIALIVIVFSSCVQKRYIHSAPVVLNPMFKEQGEGYAGIYYNSNGGGITSDATTENSQKSGGVAVQGGYALTNHFGVAGGFLYLNQKDVYSGYYSDPFDQSNVSHNRYEFTLAGDYFFADKRKKSGVNLLFGGTFGNLNINDVGKIGSADYTRYFKTNGMMLFVAPCLNIYSNENSGFGFSAKLNYVNYTNNKTNYSPSELSTLRLDNTSALYVAEFGIKGKIGFINMPITIEPQLNYIWNHSGRINVKRTNYCIGVAYQFKHNKRKK